VGSQDDHQDNQYDSRLSEDGDVALRAPPKRKGFLTHRTSGNTLVASHKYDPLGRRVERAIAGGLTQRCTHAGLQLTETFDAAQNLKQSFVFGQGIDSILMLEQADVLDFNANSNLSETTRSFYHVNAIGSVMALTDLNQLIIEDLRYGQFGQVAISRGGQAQSVDVLGQHFAYAGLHQDDEGALVCARARHLDPATGRFVQRDPRGYEPGQNLYEYARTSPTNLVDPLGEAPSGPELYCGANLGCSGDCEGEAEFTETFVITSNHSRGTGQVQGSPEYQAFKKALMDRVEMQATNNAQSECPIDDSITNHCLCVGMKPETDCETAVRLEVITYQVTGPLEVENGRGGIVRIPAFFAEQGGIKLTCKSTVKGKCGKV
jgi:RHS repeat-associated protein